MTLYVVYTPDTSHVLGAINAVGVVLPADAEASALVGKVLPLRVSDDAGTIHNLSFPVGHLAVHAPDDEPRVFDDPLAFGVTQVQDSKPKPALVAFESWEDELTFTGNSLIITVPNELSQDTPVLALVADGEETHILPGTILAGQDTTEITVTVPAGPHGVLVLVPGLAGVLKAVTKT
jgi:hypothetical protein